MNQGTLVALRGGTDDKAEEVQWTANALAAMSKNEFATPGTLSGPVLKMIGDSEYRLSSNPCLMKIQCMFPAQREC